MISLRLNKSKLINISKLRNKINEDIIDGRGQIYDQIFVENKKMCSIDL